MDNSQCYSANTFFTTPLTLDWETAFGQASNNPQNPHTVTPVAPWTTNIAGVHVGVNVGADYSANGLPSTTATLTRVDNEVYVWNPVPGLWVPPSASSDPTLVDDFTFGGHFSAPGPAKVAGDGAHLLAMFDNNVWATGSYVITFDQGIHAAGLMVSVQGGSNNINFDATIQAYGIQDPTTLTSPLLATYVIDTRGLGGLCSSLTNTQGGLPDPTPCNNAPFIGVRAPGNLTAPQIYKIVVSATTGDGRVPDSVLLGSLQFEVAAPEPAVIFLSGAGLLLIVVLRRKQGAAAGSKP